MHDGTQLERLSIDEMVSSGRENPDLISERLDEILGVAELSNDTTHIFTTILTEAALRSAENIQTVAEEQRSTMPLYGVPFALKDNCDIAGGTHNL